MLTRSICCYELHRYQYKLLLEVYIIFVFNNYRKESKSVMVAGQVARSQYERQRKEVACVIIQKCTRMFLVMKGYRALYCSAIRLQANIRGLAASNMHLHKIQNDSAVVLQVCALVSAVPNQ